MSVKTIIKEELPFRVDKGFQEPWREINHIIEDCLNDRYNHKYEILYTNIIDCNKIPESLKFICFAWNELKLIVYLEPKVYIHQYEDYNELIQDLKDKHNNILKKGMTLRNETNLKRCFLFKDLDKQTIKTLKNGKTEIKTGDFLYTSWGYDQTNVEFFTIKKILGKNYFIIQEISCNRKSDGVTSDRVSVSEDVIKVDIPIKAYISNDGYMSVCEYGYKRGLYKTELNKQHYETALGFGH